MSFRDVPNEVLLKIIAYVDNSHRRPVILAEDHVLFGLLLASKRTHDLTLKYIARYYNERREKLREFAEMNLNCLRIWQHDAYRLRLKLDSKPNLVHKVALDNLECCHEDLICDCYEFESDWDAYCDDADDVYYHPKRD